MKKIVCMLAVMVLLINFLWATDFEKDIIKTNAGNLEITFIGHGTLMMRFNSKVIHIDPVGSFADYSTLPKADLILITHEHGDHLDTDAIETIKTKNTEVVLTKICNTKYKGTAVLENGDSGVFAGFAVKAVPAYNIKNVRKNGQPYHPKGNGNGYVITFGNKKVYVAGDTENIPEMADLKDIDVAFLPMNLPYTMTPEMVANAAKMFHPKVLYPYHYGNTDTSKLLDLMKNQNETEVRIRKLN